MIFAVVVHTDGWTDNCSMKIMISIYKIKIFCYPVLWSWDVVEYLRGLSEDELVKVRTSSASEPRVALHVAMATGKDEAEVKRCKDELMSQHLSSSLRRWVEWREEGDQQKLADQTIDDSSSCESKE